MSTTVSGVLAPTPRTSPTTPEQPATPSRTRLGAAPGHGAGWSPVGA